MLDNPYNNKYQFDPTGFFTKSLGEEDAAWGRILKSKMSHDKFIESRQLDHLIDWKNVTIRHFDTEIKASLQDGQLNIQAASGGIIPNETITLIVNKFHLSIIPIPQDPIQLFANGKWIELTVEDVAGLQDDQSPSLTITTRIEPYEES